MIFTMGFEQGGSEAEENSPVDFFDSLKSTPKRAFLWRRARDFSATTVAFTSLRPFNCAKEEYDYNNEVVKYFT